MRKQLIALIAGLSLTAAPALADPIEPEDWFTPHATGCMLLGECTDDVAPIWGIDYLVQEYPVSNWNPVAEEFSRILNALTLIDVGVYLADQKYFEVGQRGIYHTVTNNFYLNRSYMSRPGVLMSVMRHEGWHAAQDCMAGTIDNSMIAIIRPEDDVPMIWQEMVERTYPESAWPWEKEATWAGKTEGMTMRALEACERGRMWEVYPPTPMTREWLEENKYIVK
jgi:hypothetical protein